MGLHDYFRAADRMTASRALDSAGGPLHRRGPGFDGVATKLEPDVILGKLVAAILHVPWDPNLMNGRWTRPPPEQQDPDEEGPWIQELSVRARDALAEVDDARLPELAADWVQAEEFSWHDIDVSELLQIATELVALARRAKKSGDHVYCWSCP
jgi:hypothetical protein